MTALLLDGVPQFFGEVGRRGSDLVDVGGDRAVLDTFLRYHFEQGLSRTRRTPEALFAPETLSL